MIKIDDVDDMLSHGHNRGSSLDQLEILVGDSNELPSDEWCQLGLSGSMGITEVVP